MNGTILEVSNLSKIYAVGGGLGRARRRISAVDGVSFTVRRGETLGLIGESGCGKSTVGRMILRLLKPDTGVVRVDGSDIASAKGQALHALRRKVQMIFQDPAASLNPYLKAGMIVGEPLENFERIGAVEREKRVASLFGQVGLSAEAIQKFSFEFSGGQRQRLGIARALAASPLLIVADEPVSALDVSVQAQIVNLMVDLQAAANISYLFISHDLGVVRYIAHRVAVMYLGRIIEIGEKNTIFDRPSHPYTRALISAAPVVDPALRGGRVLLQGDPPSPIDRPSGCAFHTRCPQAFARCRVEMPLLAPKASGQLAACHLTDPA